MKEMYSVQIRKVGTHEYRKREMLLTEEEYWQLHRKLLKAENGYILVKIYPLRERE